MSMRIETVMRVTFATIAILGPLVCVRQALAADPREVAALVRVCESEAAVSDSDCRYIAAVLARRAASGRYGRRCDLVCASRAYSGRTQPTWEGRRSSRLDGVAEIDETCERPLSWPGPWEWSSSRCRRRFELARAILDGEVLSVATALPDHWGGTMDLERADRLGLVRVMTTKTANVFFSSEARRSELVTWGNPWEAARCE
jgi:hypothetical protein